MPSAYLLLKKFAVDWQTHYPSRYVPHGLLQIHYAMPKLPHCYIICQQHSKKLDPTCVTPLNDGQLSAFFYDEAKRLSKQHTPSTQNFILFESGHLVRRRQATRHAHIFIIQHRRQKAWLYTILASKNILLVLRACCSARLTK